MRAWIESYTMLTMNANQRPLTSRMHRSDPKRPPDGQDKRSVVQIEIEDVDQRLHGTIEQAAKLVRLSDPSTFHAAALEGDAKIA